MTRPTAAFGLALFVVLGWSMIRASAPTYDEPVHLASGYAALLNGSRLINGRDHPPLAEMWAALPLLALRPAAFFHHPDWVMGRVYNYADFFLYKNRVDGERMLNAARLWCLLSWGGLLALGILAWARRLGGDPAMAAAGLLLGLCPPLFTNAGLVTTDAGSAALFFLMFWILGSPTLTWPRWLAAGAVMGAAMACKFNMFILPFFAAAMLLADWRLRRRLAPPRQGRPARGEALPAPARFPARSFAAALLMAVLVLAAVYRFAHWPAYWQGLSATLGRLGEGRGSFLLGGHFTTGHPFYFPLALAVKTPIPLLLAAGVGFWALWRGGDVPRAGSLRDLAWLACPPAAYFCLALLSKTQIGYRHILPVYPFLVVAGAVGAAWILRQRRGRVLGVLLATWLAASVLRAHPHYLAYFNEAAGGPTRGYRCLVDSNLDWGQGLKPLAQWLRRLGNPPIFLCYFGVADPSYYGIRYMPVGGVTNVERQEGTALPGESDAVILAVSATNLQTTYYADHGLFDWLKRRTPVFVAGYSIFVYDLTRDVAGALSLADLMAASGLAEEASRLRKRYAHPG